MGLIYRNPTLEDKQKICAWHYEGEYAVYDLPSYDEMIEKKMGFGNPEKEVNFLVFLEGESLVGFVNLLEEEREVFIGIGVAPEFCGKGYGTAILLETCRISRERYPEKPLYLEVRSWNKRAVRCYEKAGFVIDGEPFRQKTHMGMGTFYRMTKA